MRSVSTIVVEPRTLLREGLVSVLRHSGFKVISAVPALDKIPHAALGRASLLTIGAASETAEALEYLNRSCPPARKAKVVIITEVSGKISQPDTLKILSNGADCCIVNVRSRDVLLRSLHLAILGQWVVVVGEDGVPLDAFEAERDTGSFNGHEPRMNGEHAPRINGEHASRINGEHATQYLNGGYAAQLSARELEILKFLVAGDSNKIIARTCKLAESTVKIHLKTILRKIGVRNRTQAAIWAMQHVNGHEAA